MKTGCQDRESLWWLARLTSSRQPSVLDRTGDDQTSGAENSTQTSRLSNQISGSHEFSQISSMNHQMENKKLQGRNQHSPNTNDKLSSYLPKTPKSFDIRRCPIWPKIPPFHITLLSLQGEPTQGKIESHRSGALGFAFAVPCHRRMLHPSL